MNNQEDIVLVYHIDWTHESLPTACELKDFHDQSSKIRFRKTMTELENGGWEQMKKIDKKIASPSRPLKILIMSREIKITFAILIFFGIGFNHMKELVE